jgi:hypothetical protein
MTCVSKRCNFKKGEKKENFKETYGFKKQNYSPQQNQNINKHSTVKTSENKRPFGSWECRDNYPEGVCVGLD